MSIKEILVLHHSHFDIGYTHTQPVLWELQREFIDGALNLLEETIDWPEISQPRWTVEATGQIIKWLETASDIDIDRFRILARQKRIGISAMLAHTTPLANAEQLARQIYPIRYLRNEFDININTLNQHDVNGVPWSLVDIMLDAGIELLTMAVNLHFGGSVDNRPSIFNWQGPSGRTIRVMNGAHYTMFDQLLDTHMNDVAAMKKGLDTYISHLKKKNYPFDFLYLTTANAPVCYDNSPPNIDVARLIRQWNDEGRTPVIRYVTPELLLERIRKIPANKLRTLRGDWTDYWNFGCSSNAAVTRININTKPRLFTVDMLRSVNKPGDHAIRQISDRAWWNLNIYDEHTWGSYNSLAPDTVFSRVQAGFKDILAYNARELTEYLIVNELESLAENPDSAYHQDGVMVVNTSPVKKTEYLPVPDWWHLDGKRLRTARFGWNYRHEQMESAPLYGPVEIEPFSWKKIPLKKLKKAKPEPGVKHGKVNPADDQKVHGSFISDTIIVEKYFIESDSYRLEYDAPTGRITSLVDKKRKWQVIDTQSPWQFFQPVHEEPDRLVNPGRTALYARDMMGEKYDVSLWQTEWKAQRQGPVRTLECRVDVKPDGISLIRKFEMNGTRDFEQTIKVMNHSPFIELSVRFHKEDIRSAEALYFTFPINLAQNWRCHFDTAGIPVELDHEQLPGACRDWVTVESFVSVHEARKGVSLVCPDAPMVQVGDFNFGRKHSTIDRNANPLLLAWPLNNYWDTNFRASQPGFIEMRYYFRTHGPFNPLENLQSARSVLVPAEIHPALNCKQERARRFFELSGPEAIHILHIKPAEDGNDMIFKMISLDKNTINAKLSVPGRKISQAFICTTLEENISPVEVASDSAMIDLDPGKITTIRLVFAK